MFFCFGSVPLRSLSSYEMVDDLRQWYVNGYHVEEAMCRRIPCVNMNMNVSVTVETCLNWTYVKCI